MIGVEVEDDAGILSNMKWKVRSALPLKIDSIGIMEGRYLAIAKGDSSRLMSLLRVGLAETMDDGKLDYSTAVKITLQQQRMKGLFDGLHRSKIPFLYLILVKPTDQGGDDNEVFEFDLVVGTWMDVKAKKAAESMATLEQNTGVLAATLAVGVPNSSVRRLTRNELKDFGQNLLQPTEQKLRQVADSSTISRLESFDSRNPAVQSPQSAPDFYVPNVAESGTSGILLGKVRTRSGTSHDFRLQLDDLRRHTAILGMTGAGKSTSASVIVRQVAGMGLPLMILDWHNEHADLIRSIGGQIFSPGKDQFTINPLDMTSSTRPDRAHRDDDGHLLGHLSLQPPAGLHVPERSPEVPRRGLRARGAHDLIPCQDHRRVSPQVGLRQRDQGGPSATPRAADRGAGGQGSERPLEPHGRRARGQGPRH